jgi:hypothetical protein
MSLKDIWLFIVSCCNRTQAIVKEEDLSSRQVNFSAWRIKCCQFYPQLSWRSWQAFMSQGGITE